MRWLQFRLRTLIWLTTLACCALAWWALVARQHATEGAALARIGPMRVSRLTPDRSLVLIAGRPASLNRAVVAWQGPEWLREPLERWRCPCLYRVERIQLYGAFNDQVIDELEALRWLRRIELRQTGVSQQGLRRLREAFPRAYIVYSPLDVDDGASRWFVPPLRPLPYVLP